MTTFAGFPLSPSEIVADAVVDLLSWDATVSEWATVGGKLQIARCCDPQIVPAWPYPWIIVAPVTTDDEPQIGARSERTPTVQITVAYDERRVVVDAGEKTAASIIEHIVGLARDWPRLDHRQGAPAAQRLATIQRLGLTPIYVSDEQVDSTHSINLTYLLEAS